MIYDSSKYENIGGGISIGTDVPNISVKHDDIDKEQINRATAINVDFEISGKKTSAEDLGFNTDITKAQEVTNANRDQILNALGHEFGHYSKEDNKTGNQSIANYSGNKLEDRTKDMVAKEATEDTLVAIRNNKNVITGEEGRQLAESIPMDRREYYKAIMINGSISKLLVGGGVELGIIYNKDPITGKEEYGYVIKVQASGGIDYNVKNIKKGLMPVNIDFGVEEYEKEGKPIKDFQGIRGKISGSVGFFGVGINGEINAEDEVSVSGGVVETGVKVMLDLVYMKVFKIENPSEFVKESIKTLTNNPEKIVGNIETIKLLKDIIKKAEELKK